MLNYNENIKKEMNWGSNVNGNKPERNGHYLLVKQNGFVLAKYVTAGSEIISFGKSDDMVTKLIAKKDGFVQDREFVNNDDIVAWMRLPDSKDEIINFFRKEEEDASF